jgi:Holliday junction resolvase RusA-like endonuclease
MTVAGAVGVAARPEEARSISFVVPGEPAGKARPRVTRHGTYTPDPKGFVTRVSEYGTEARTKAGQGLFEGPVGLQVIIYRAMPKSWSRKKQAAMVGEYSPTTPDTVNIVAAVADGLNKIIYEDDRQIAHIAAYKYWAREHRTKITVQPL